MAEFYTTLTNNEIARQIADMINRYNRWYASFSERSILHGPTRYFVETVHSKIVGCAGIARESPSTSKLIHVCTLPECRGMGIAKKLSECAIASTDTEYIYMTIREDNIPSIRLANALRFQYFRKHRFMDHFTLSFGRKRDG